MASFGISILSSGGQYVESAEVSSKAEYKQLIASDGTSGGAHIYDTTFSISARGKGDGCPFTAGGTIAATGVTGKTIVTSAKDVSKNDDYQGWEVTAVGYAHAS
jgi:hypothetical protein